MKCKKTHHKSSVQDIHGQLNLNAPSCRCSQGLNGPKNGTPDLSPFISGGELTLDRPGLTQSKMGQLGLTNTCKYSQLSPEAGKVQPLTRAWGLCCFNPIDYPSLGPTSPCLTHQALLPDLPLAAQAFAACMQQNTTQVQVFQSKMSNLGLIVCMVIHTLCLLLLPAVTLKEHSVKPFCLCSKKQLPC